MSSGSSDNPVARRLSRALRSTFLSLRNRNFRLYFIGQLISNTGNWLTNVALVLLARIFHEHPGSGADLATKDPPEQG